MIEIYQCSQELHDLIEIFQNQSIKSKLFYFSLVCFLRIKFISLLNKVHDSKLLSQSTNKFRNKDNKFNEFSK